MLGWAGADSVDSSAELESEWPNLSKTEYRITSPYTRIYNCFAWAAHEDDRWWSPLPESDYYWPDGAPREQTLGAYICAYQTLGFEPCEDGLLETGFEKIAIYLAPSGEPQHIARQVANGKWTSKLGVLEDIEHELDGLAGDLYGSVQQFMKRPL